MKKLITALLIACLAVSSTLFLLACDESDFDDSSSGSVKDSSSSIIQDDSSSSGSTDEELIAYRQEKLTLIDEKWGELSEKKDVYDYESEYLSIISGISEAATTAKVDEFMVTFNALCERIDSEQTELTQKQKELLTRIYSNYKTFLQLKPEEKTLQLFTEQYNSLRQAIKSTTNDEALSQVETQVDEFVESVESAIESAFLSFISQALEKAEDMWSDACSQHFGTDIADDEKYTSEYEKIKNAISNAKTVDEVNKLLKEDLVKLISEATEFYGTRFQLNEYVHAQWQDILLNYESRITNEMKANYKKYSQAIFDATTLTEMQTAYGVCKAFLDQLEAELSSTDDPALVKEAANNAMGVVNSAGSEEAENVPAGLTYTLSDELLAEKTALLSALENATTLRQINDLKTRIEKFVADVTAYIPQGVKKQIKSEFAASWKEVNSTNQNCEWLYNQFVLTVDICYVNIGAYDYCYLYELKRSFNSFISSVASDGGDGVFYIAVEIVDCWSVSLPTEIANKYHPEFMEYSDLVKGSQSWEETKTNFENMKAFYEKVKNEVFVKEHTISIESITVTMGADKDVLINKIVANNYLSFTFSDGTTKKVDLTKDMLIYSDLDLSKPGNFSISVTYNITNYGSFSFSITVKVEPDMNTTKVTGTYTAVGALNELVGKENVPFVFYDIGYVKIADYYRTYKKINDYIEIDSGYKILVKTDDETGKISLYIPEQSTVLLQTYISYPYSYYFTVFGNYTPAGEYVVVVSNAPLLFDDQDSDNIKCVTYCTLDMDKKTFKCDFVSSDILFDYTENGGEMTKNLDALKKELKEKIAAKWQGYIDFGYDVEFMRSEYNSFIAQIDTISDEYVLNELEYQFDNNIGIKITNNYVTELYIDGNDNLSFSVKVGTDINKFLNDNVIGKKLEVKFFYSGSKYVTITRDMIDFTGDFSYSGNYMITVKYYGIGSDGSKYITINVDVYEEA